VLCPRWWRCVRPSGQSSCRARPPAGLRHEAALPASPATLPPAPRAHPVASSGGRGGGWYRRVGGAPRGVDQTQGVAGGAGGGRCGGAWPAPPQPRAQLPLRDRLQGWFPAQQHGRPARMELECLLLPPCFEINLVICMLWMLQGSVCGESSCFRIINSADNSGNGGSEILYVIFTHPTAHSDTLTHAHLFQLIEAVTCV
jgi:hypothetical protein